MIDLFGSDSDDWDDDDFGADLAEAVEVYCPYCGESIDLGVDQAGGGVQEYVEDCQVCCRPISVLVHCAQGELLAVSLHHENETP